MKPLDNFYANQKEPIKSCFIALREIILSFNDGITNEYKYGGSFFLYKGKSLCYLWIHKKLQQPYIGFVKGFQLKHPKLISEKRSQIKILLIDINEDLQIEEINKVLKEAISLYKNIKT